MKAPPFTRVTAPPTAGEVRTALEIAAAPEEPSEFPPMRKDARDLTDQRFGKLVVLKRAPNLQRKTSKIQWHARCDCGTELTLRTDRFFAKPPGVPATHCGCERTYKARGPKTGAKAAKPEPEPAPPREPRAPRQPTPPGPRVPPTAAELEEAKLRTAGQMRAIGERWSTVAEYLGTTIEQAKHILSPEEDPPT